MNTNLSKKFEEEFLSFFALYLANLVLGALTMALGLMFMVQQIGPEPGTIPTGIPTIVSPLSILFGGIAFVLGLVWIAATAKLMKSVKVIRAAYKEKKKREMTDEDFTGMMVHMMTQYREQKPMIRAMVAICLVGGCLFLAQGVLAVIPLVGGIARGDAMIPVLVGILAVGINLIMGMAGIRISQYFRRYATAWDARLDALTRSEDELKQMLGKA